MKFEFTKILNLNRLGLNHTNFPNDFARLSYKGFKMGGVYMIHITLKKGTHHIISYSKQKGERRKKKKEREKNIREKTKDNG